MFSLIIFSGLSTIISIYLLSLTSFKQHIVFVTGPYKQSPLPMRKRSVRAQLLLGIILWRKKWYSLQNLPTETGAFHETEFCPSLSYFMRVHSSYTEDRQEKACICCPPQNQGGDGVCLHCL